MGIDYSQFPEHLQKVKYPQRSCVGCGEIWTPQTKKRYANGRYCSPGCAARHTQTKTGREQSCKWCGTKFYCPPSVKKQFCSRHCWRKWRVETNPKRFDCAVCGQRVTAEIYPGRKTCSKACGYEYRKLRTRRAKPCKTCGELFWPRFQSRGVAERWCSRECLNEWRRRLYGKRKYRCKNCGLVFMAYPKQKRKFCSHACSSTFSRGENHAGYRGTVDPNRGSGWKRLARAIRARDGFACRRCGRTQEDEGKGLHVDHVVPWRTFDNKDEANDPANLVTLCNSCHTSKTGTIERQYLRGDKLPLDQFRRDVGIAP